METRVITLISVMKVFAVYFYIVGKLKRLEFHFVCYDGDIIFQIFFKNFLTDFSERVERRKHENQM